MKLSTCVLALFVTAALGACGSHTSTEPTASETKAGAPESKPGLSLSGGRLVLPAVKGNPGAVYFMLANTSGKPATLAAVDVAGAGMAMLHETLSMEGHSSMQEMKGPEIKPGETLVLAPGGKHVMVDRVPAEWKPGGTTELTLTFADGDKLSAPLALEAPGGQ